MSTLRIFPFEAKSTTGFNPDLGYSYYFSFENKDNSFFDKLCPYLEHCEGSCCLGSKKISSQKNGATIFNNNEKEKEYNLMVSKSLILFISNDSI